jgi:ribosomal protein S27E
VPILVRAIDPVANTVQVQDTEGGHEATVNFSVLALLGNAVRVTCPVCGATSCSPPGGGADAPWGQRLYAAMLRRAAAGRTWLQARAILRALVMQQEGLARYRLTDVATEGA